MSNITFGYAAWAAMAQESTFGVPPTGTNAVQTITPGADATGGAFTISQFGLTTASIDHAASLSTLNGDLLTTFGTTLVGGVVTQNVVATGGPLSSGDAFTLTYHGIYGNKPIPTLTFGTDTISGTTIVAASATAGVAPVMVPFELMDESIELKQMATPKPVLGTTSNTHSVHSKSDTSGSLKHQGQFNGIERMLYNTFGAVVDAEASGETIVYTHTYSRTDALPTSLSVLIDRDSTDLGVQFLYPGMQIDKLTLEQDVDDMLQITQEMIGNGQEILTYPIAKPSSHAFNQIDYLMVSSVTVNGVTIPAKKLKFTIDNKLNKDRYLLGSNLRNGIQRSGVVEVTGEITLEFQSTAQILLFEQYTSFVVNMVWTGANIPTSAVPTPFSLAIQMKNCVLSGKTPNVKDWSVIEQELNFTAFSSSVGALDEVSAVLTNDVSTQV